MAEAGSGAHTTDVIGADAGTTTAIIIAVISLLASVLAAVLSVVVKGRLDEEGRERDARRDYVYEAKKRLYEQCEPLLFQALELSEGARDRIISLARSARNDVIRSDGGGWLSEPGYYFKSTAYLLVAPMTTFKLLQSRLTLVDLGLEPRLRQQYEFLKLLYLSYTTDFELASEEPKLSYNPDRADPGEPERERLLIDEPQVYARQGLYRARLEVVANAFIHREAASGGLPAFSRCKTYGEFVGEFDLEDSDIYAIREELDDLFRGFHPLRKPVLWRVLVTQALLHEALLRAQGSGSYQTEFDAARANAIGRRGEELNWRTVDATNEGGEADQIDDASEPVLVAERYVAAATASLQGLNPGSR